MSRPELSISFHNFESGFVPAKFSLVRGLAERFDVKIETLGRDIQFFSVWGKDLIPTRNRPRARARKRCTAAVRTETVASGPVTGTVTRDNVSSRAPMITIRSPSVMAST